MKNRKNKNKSDLIYLFKFFRSKINNFNVEKFKNLLKTYFKDTFFILSIKA